MPSAKSKPKSKGPTTANIHAVVGSDEVEVKRVAAELATRLTPPDAGEFGVEIIDGCADNADQAAGSIRSTVGALQTLPFFGGSKLVWLKNANFLADSVIGRAATVQTALEELSEVISGDLGEVNFLISAIDVDKRRSFYKTLGKRAEVQVFDKLDSSRSGWEEEAAVVVQQHASKLQLEFQADALDLFVLLTGGDTRQIMNEMEKIDLYLGKEERSVDVDLVREIVPLTRAGVIFELGNALAQRDLERALKLLGRLLEQGETAIAILLVAILPTVRNLLLAKDLMEHNRMSRPHAPFQFISALNRLPASSTEHLPRKKDGAINGYALGIAAQNAHRFETKTLVEGMEACLDANLRLVSTQLDHEVILTELLVKLLAN